MPSQDGGNPPTNTHTHTLALHCCHQDPQPPSTPGRRSRTHAGRSRWPEGSALSEGAWVEPPRSRGDLTYAGDRDQ